MKISTRLIARLAAGAAVLAFTQQANGAAQQEQQQQQKPKDVRPSKGAVKALSELQAAVKSKDAAQIQAKVAAAQAVLSTNEDRYILAQLQLQAAADVNDKPAAMAAMDAMLASGFLTPAEAAPVYKNLSELRFGAKQYDQAATLLEKRLQLNPSDMDAIALLVETRNAQGRGAEAVATLQRGIQLQSAGGRKPDEAWMRRAAALAYTAKLPNATELARQWVTAYPSPISWQSSIGIYRNLNRPDAESVIDLMRLMRATGAMIEPADFAIYLETLNLQSNFIEAQTALEKARQSGKFDASNADLKEAAAVIDSKPKVTAADLATAAKSAPNGASLLRIGDRFYGLGDYAKAAEIYKQAGAKGVEANLINERVGVALAAAGDKAGAIAAFKAVTGPRAGVAQFWLLYLQNQG